MGVGGHGEGEDARGRRAGFQMSTPVRLTGGGGGWFLNIHD